MGIVQDSGLPPFGFGPPSFCFLSLIIRRLCQANSITVRIDSQASVLGLLPEAPQSRGEMTKSGLGSVTAVLTIGCSG
jgi:hypothetical protein